MKLQKTKCNGKCHFARALAILLLYVLSGIPFINLAADDMWTKKYGRNIIWHDFTG
ncbi:hypothetical protein GF312_11570 [Candidatus Poribacteria bacterium]|nr:hypothetical protein [Candidatus Poribacteria bacterium]